jgi:anaerobic magnesium-protoporphyrin IX monomethyl ester cyclase
MAEVLLTHSYFLHFDPKEYRAMMPYPPLGTLYAAGYLRARGVSVAIHDVMFSTSEDGLLQALDRHRPALVVIYDDQFNYLTKMCLGRMRDAAFAMTRLAKQRGCNVIIFSSDATDHVEQYIAHGADYVICGEAEETLGELVASLLSSDHPSVETIRGVAHKENGRIVGPLPRPLLTDLDTLPFPAWDLLDFDPYRSSWKQKHHTFSLNLVTTRGCPFHCNWCAKPIYGQVYHSRSPRNVVDEMLWLKEIARPDHIWFADDIFGLKPGWVAEFRDEVEKRHASIPFKCLSRADLLLKGDTIRDLKASGCQTIWVGAESGSQRVLDAMDKGTTVEQIYRATSRLHEAGIHVGFFLQYGYPGETLSDIAKTLEMVHDCRPDEIGISVSYPLPGTRFYERVLQELGEKHNWVDSGDLDMMFRGSYQPDFYRTLHTVTHKKFRIWQGKQLFQRILSDPLKAGRIPWMQLAKSVYHAVTLPNLETRLSALAMPARRP